MADEGARTTPLREHGLIGNTSTAAAQRREAIRGLSGEPVPLAPRALRAGGSHSFVALLNDNDEALSEPMCRRCGFQHQDGPRRPGRAPDSGDALT